MDLFLCCFSRVIKLLIPCFCIILLSWRYSLGQVKISQPQNDSLILNILQSDKAFFSPYLQNPKKYYIQIIYTQIDRSTSTPKLNTYSFGVDTSQYFFPASMVKLPLSALALEKIRKLNLPGLTRESIMHHGSEYFCQWAEKSPDTSLLGRPSVGNYIRKMMLVSDNMAYNRIYEFLGPNYITENLTAKGYPSARVIQRFAPCSPEANRHTNPVTFLDKNGGILLKQPGQISKLPLKNPASYPYVGRAHYTNGGKFVRKPYYFGLANNLVLPDVHNMVISLIMPEAIAPENRFDLDTSDYYFLRRYMGMYPRESGMKEYADKKTYYDSYKKYLIFGRAQATCPDSLRIYNIVGMAHGFLADCAYISDPANKVEFFLSALIYSNADEVLNDSVYQYGTVGLPYLKRLGQVFLDYERKRKNSRQ